jgi:hypothetical protein
LCNGGSKKSSKAMVSMQLPSRNAWARDVMSSLF